MVIDFPADNGSRKILPNSPRNLGINFLILFASNLSHSFQITTVPCSEFNTFVKGTASTRWGAGTVETCPETTSSTSRYVRHMTLLFVQLNTSTRRAWLRELLGSPIP